MTFKDIFKNSFLDEFAVTTVSSKQILLVLGIVCLISLYIYFCYRYVIRRTFYSKNFNISLVALAILTAAIILTIQSSIVVSLGMVGALSIVRFRTAIKDPMDLIFLFWSIAVGIICGAGLIEIAIWASLAVTVMIFILDRLPIAHAPMILVISASLDKEVDDKIGAVIRKYSNSYKEKSRNLSSERLDLVFELRTKDGKELTREIGECKGVNSVSLLSHDGEVTF